MKKLLTIAAIAAATSALAVESSNTFGILRVDSTAEQTIVSVPWENAGGGAIKVKDVVKTANLTKGDDAEGKNGDQLFCYSGTTYKMWQLNDAGVWVGATIVMTGKTVERGSDSDVLNRGDALILIRHTYSQPFYLYGQYAALTGSDTTTVAQGSSTTPAYTLLAPPTTEAFNLNGNNVMTGAPDAADRIAVPNNDGQSLALLKYDSTNDGWGIKKATFDTSMATIPAGQGVWYVSRGGKPTFHWNSSAQ